MKEKAYLDGYSPEDVQVIEELERRGKLTPNQQTNLNNYRGAQANARQRGASEFSQLSRGGMPLGPGAIPDTNAPIAEDNSFQEAGDTFKKELKGYLGGAQIPYLSPAAIGVAGTITDDVINQYDRVRSGQYNAESPLVRLSRMADSLKTNYKMADDTIKDWKSEGEFGATLGRIPRDVLLFELGSAALGGAGAGASAAGNSSKWAKLGNFGKDVGRTTLIGTGIDQLENPDFNRIGSDIKTNAGMDLFLRGLATGGRKTGEGIYNFLKNPKRNQEFIDTTTSSIPFFGKIKDRLKGNASKNAEELYKTEEAIRKAKHDSGVYELMSQYEDQEAKRQIAHQLEKRDAVESFKGLINNDGTSAAENLKKILDDRSLALSRQYDEAVTPVMQRYAGIEINPQNTVSKIDELLKQYQLVDDAGKPSVKALNDLFDPEIKSTGQSLLKSRKKLSGNPTIQDLELANRQFGDIANFGKPVKSSKEKIFGNLYHQGRNDLTDALEKAASPGELQALLGAKQNYASNKGLLDEMLKTFNKPSDRLAVNLRSKIPGSKISELVDKIPESKDPLSDLFLNMLTQSSSSPRKFTKEIDYYGRDVLENLLGKEKFKQLIDAEKRLHKSNIPFKKSIRPTPIPYKEAPKPELTPGLTARGLAKIGSAFDPANRTIQNREFTYMLNSPIKKLIEMNDPEAEPRKLYNQMKRGKKMSDYEKQKILDFLENSQ